MTILTTLLSVILIFSNIISTKNIQISNLSFTASSFIYPFVFLIVAIITYKYGAKEGIKSVLIAISSQIIIWLLSTLICNMPTDPYTSSQAGALKSILTPNLTNGYNLPNLKMAFGSILGFSISQLINIGILNFTQKYTIKFASSTLAIFVAMIIDSIIFNIIITPQDLLLNTITNQFIIRVFMTILSIIIFCVFTSKKENSN